MTKYICPNAKECEKIHCGHSIPHNHRDCTFDCIIGGIHCVPVDNTPVDDTPVDEVPTPFFCYVEGKGIPRREHSIYKEKENGIELVWNPNTGDFMHLRTEECQAELMASYKENKPAEL